MSEPVSGPDLPAETSPIARVQDPGRRALVAALAGGIVATALSWAAGEASVDRFKLKLVGERTEAIDTGEANAVVVKNAALAWGLQGALLGLTLGLAGAAARRQARAASGAGLAGLVVGGGLGAAGSFLVFTTYFKMVNPVNPDMVPSLLSHAGVAALLGASGGLAFGLGLGGRGRAVRATIGGLLGAALGSGLYDVLGGVFFAVDKTGDPVAGSVMARLLCHALIDLLAALGAAAFATSGGAGAAKAPSEPAVPADGMPNPGKL